METVDTILATIVSKVIMSLLNLLGSGNLGPKLIKILEKQLDFG